MKAKFKNYCHVCKLVATSSFGDVYVCRGHSVLYRYGDDRSQYAAYDVGSSVSDAKDGFKRVQDFKPDGTLAQAALDVIRIRMPSVWHNLFEKAPNS